MRKETSEVYTVTNHMGIVNRRLDKLINKEDSFLVEVKEEVLLFQPNCPTIKIMINQEKVIRHEAAGRSLKPKVRRDLNLALKELSGSSYNEDIKRITCGKCKSGVKPRLDGEARSIFKGIYIQLCLVYLQINIHFPDNHFDICGDHEKKRKAKEDAEEEQVKKKARELEKNKQFWKSLESDKRMEEDGEEDLDLFVDSDLVEVHLLASENLG